MRVQEKLRERVSIGLVRTLRMLEEHRAGVLSCARCHLGIPGGVSPVVDLPKAVRAMLVAQAPGSTEVVTRLPFTGPAGKRLMGWFERAGMSRAEIYLSAVARCFPGKAKGGGDLVPSRAMIRNCRPPLAREIELLKPEVDVPVGGLAADSLGARRAGELGFAAAQAAGVTSVLVPDEAIAEARQRLWDEVRLVSEPGGAAALAALTSGAYRPAPGERVAAVLCGANTDPHDLTPRA